MLHASFIYVISLDLISLIILGKEYNLPSSSLCRFENRRGSTEGTKKNGRRDRKGRNIKIKIGRNAMHLWLGFLWYHLTVCSLCSVVGNRLRTS
jgi:hypothetical protein